MVATRIHDPASERWQFLVTTNRGLESIAIDELTGLGAVDCTVHHPGVIACTGAEAFIYRLHARSRSTHRLLLELARGDCSDLGSIYELTRAIPIPTYLGPDQSFAVRAQRRGDHSFGSPDVEDRVGQAIIDEYRSRERTRPPVDLDDPAVIFRVFVRDRQVRLTVDTTGQRSLHRRQYRKQEHEAPIRPTMAYAMFKLADCQPGDRVVDPMCGCGTIPIEVACAELGRPPTIDGELALSRLQFLDADQYERLRDGGGSGDLSMRVAGFDIDESAIESARTNASEAALDDRLTFAVADARTRAPDADVLITDMPFGIRTGEHGDGNLHSLYHGFSDRLEEGSWRRAVVHTARGDLLDIEATERIPMRRGRLETEILIFESA